MSVRNLLDPILEQGVLHTNFFEGRLLTAGDLRDQQDATRAREQRFGRALGAGIVHGLEVVLEKDGTDGSVPVVTVRSGLAINGEGEIIGLPKEDVQVALSRSISASPTASADFYACAGAPDSKYLPNGVGIYILVMSPVAGYKDRAPKCGLGDEGVIKGCGDRYVQEGVQFRLLDVTTAVLAEKDPAAQSLLKDLLSQTTPATVGETARLSLLRNLLAWQRFRTEFEGANALALALRRGIDASVDGSGATACDVPLGLIYWTFEGVAFLDLWAVRRMVVPDGAGREVERSRTRGIERLRQFSEQMDWLVPRLAQVETPYIGDYFRYIPGGAFLPVRAPGVSYGVRVTDFLAGLFRGGPIPAGLGQGSRLLVESLTYEYLDLSKTCQVQRYLLVDGSGNALDVAPNRQYECFFSRDLCGPMVSDDTAKVLKDAWEVYRGLVKRQVFLPPASDDAKIAARDTISDNLRAVLDVTNRGAALALGSALDYDAAIDCFGAMYAVQAEMVASFSAAIPGIEDTQERELFASVIGQYLEHTLSDHSPGLKAALAATNLDQAVAAQIEINRFVGSWSGEGVAVGPFYFVYSESPNGVGLVPGGAATPHIFRLRNGTNRTLELALSGSASAAHGDWANRCSILGALNGTELFSVVLASGAERDVVVMLSAPANSQVGDPVTVELRAKAGPPTNRESVYVNSTLFAVDSESGSDVSGEVLITECHLDVVPDDVPPNDWFVLHTSVKYSARDGAESGEFSFQLVITGGDDAGWQFADHHGGALLDKSGSTYSQPITVPGDAMLNPVNVNIRGPERSQSVDRTVKFKLGIKSTDAGGVASYEYPEEVSLTVKKA